MNDADRTKLQDVKIPSVDVRFPILLQRNGRVEVVSRFSRGAKHERIDWIQPRVKESTGQGAMALQK